MSGWAGVGGGGGVISVVGQTGAVTGAQIAADPALVAAFVAQAAAPYYFVGSGGTIDDTTALQTALNTAVTAGRALEIIGRTKTTAPIVLPVNTAVTIRTSVADSNPFGSETQDKASIESTGAAVFTSAGGGDVFLLLQNVNFRNNGATSAVVFSGVVLNTSTIERNTTSKYASVFDSTSGIVGVTKVHGNWFLNSGTVFCAGYITDGIVTENYINGDPTTNATAFTGGIATSLIAHNYIDFFKRVFDVPQGNADVRVEGNIFDITWNTLGSSSGQNIGSWTFVGNTWHKSSMSTGLTYFPNADSDMTGTPWRAIDAGTNALTSTTATGNSVINVDCFIRAHGGVGALREGGNTYSVSAGMIDIEPSFYTLTPPDVIIQALDEGFIAPTYAAAMTIDWSQGSHQALTLTGNLSSLSFSNAIKNRIVQLRLIQDGTGGRTLASPAAAIKFGGTPALSVAANAEDCFTFFFDGTNYYELSRSMNDGGSVFTPMGNAWQLGNGGQTDYFNGSDSFPRIRLSPANAIGPGTYGGLLWGRGNISPDASMARGNDNQPSFIANCTWLKKITAFTLTSNGAVSFSAYVQDIYVATLQANVTTFSMSTAATSGTSYRQEITIEFVQDSTGSRTLAGVAANIHFAGGTPTLTTTPGKTDSFTFSWDPVNSIWKEKCRAMNV